MVAANNFVAGMKRMANAYHCQLTRQRTSRRSSFPKLHHPVPNAVAIIATIPGMNTPSSINTNLSAELGACGTNESAYPPATSQQAQVSAKTMAKYRTIALIALARLAISELSLRFGNRVGECKQVVGPDLEILPAVRDAVVEDVLIGGGGAFCMVVAGGRVASCPTIAVHVGLPALDGAGDARVNHDRARFRLPECVPANEETKGKSRNSG